jgi:hypothetical protein
VRRWHALVMFGAFLNCLTLSAPSSPRTLSLLRVAGIRELRGIADIFLELLFPKQLLVREVRMPESDALSGLPVLSSKRFL